MATRYIEHVTAEGERWDQIAAKYYGDPHRYEPIIAANADVAIRPILGSGIVVKVPVLEAETVTAASQLPPWKR